MIPSLQSFIERNNISDNVIRRTLKQLDADIKCAEDIVNMLPYATHKRLNVGAISQDGVLEIANALCIIRQAQKRLVAQGCTLIAADPASALLMGNCEVTYMCPWGHFEAVPVEECYYAWNLFLCKQCVHIRVLAAHRTQWTMF